MEAQTSSSTSIRVALEGCGHGCLHDIYASVDKAAELKGWDGVDLVIIGGDFQAVRNSNDIACMSVPQKYKELGDFHEYYSGQRTAPYLTIFIGGNHEAGNHLFELYYGGWVAPNIYYLGAANVIRCGPLRIAGMSGIWKGYDYRKPHFERLPYNSDDIQSIYHVRELDVRKLLQIRTQVDLGLSHDWPKQVEYSGDFETLFRIKRGFREDSENGRLGNMAAKYVLDRLRPAYWFSAHLHVKFVASIQHGEYVIPGNNAKGQPIASHDSQRSSNVPYSFGLDGGFPSSIFSGDDEAAKQPPSLSASKDSSNKLVQEPGSHSEENSTDIEPSRQLPESEILPQQSASIPEPQESAPAQVMPADTQSRLSAWNNFHTVAARNEAAENSRFLVEREQNHVPSATDVKHNLTWRKVDVNEDGAGRKLTGVERSGSAEPHENKKQKTQHEAVKNADEIDLDLDSGSDQEAQPNPTVQPNTGGEPAPSSENVASLMDGSSSVNIRNEHQANESGVSEEIRSQLPASFMRPAPDPHPVNEGLPDAISNKTTDFLALDKCLPNRHFLQLVEFNTISGLDGAQPERPYRLQYDKEWLAITRAFAGDLQLGDPTARPPADKGDSVYKPQIKEAEAWIEEHVVKPGKMTVPENFTLTAPIYDPAIPITTEEMPFEITNPQTAQFCELIGIENKFHLSDEERQARMAAGPRPAAPGSNFRRGGGHGRGRGGYNRGRGHGRGRGRGRGNQYR